MAFPQAKLKTIDDAAAAWFRSAPFRKGGTGALNPRKRSATAEVRDDDAVE